uniref:Pentacotripeptide-repeat region of PRORP domain-containing protein n=1 Tax=Amphora coffeiformis TaxID=265554 RepID=A0A7S3L9Z4_9STRA
MLEKAQRLSKGKLHLTASTYNALLECCAQSSGQGQYQYFANEALRLIEEMRSLAIQQNNNSIAPNIKSYTSAIRCLANGGDGKGAEALFDEMMTAYKESGDRRLQPDPVIFNTVLTAYNKSKEEDALQGAQGFFSKCWEMHRKGDISKGPDSYSFTTLLSCISRANGDGKVAVERAKIAAALLHQLHGLYNKEKNADWQPSTATYNAVMNCWAKAGSPGNCEATLDKMLEDHRSGNDKASPDIQSFNILMKSLASCNFPNAGKRADDLLNRINELHRDRVLNSGPNSITYTTLIHCHVQSGTPEGIARAEAVLREMELQHEKGNLNAPPNDSLYEMIRKAKGVQHISPDLPPQIT